MICSHSQQPVQMKMLHEGDMGQQADTDETQMPVMLTGA